jgi:PAS domain S-box-containing protein
LHPDAYDTWARGLPVTLTELESGLDRALFEDAPVGLAFLDRDLRYVRLNRALATINGRSIEDHLGRTVAEVVPQIEPRVLDAMRSVLDTGEPIDDFEIEVELLDAPQARAFLENYHPVRDADGSVVGLNCSVVEITERKRIEAAARTARDAADLLANLNGELAASTSIADVARLVVQATGPAFGALTSGLFLLGPDGMLRIAGAAGYSPDVLEAFSAWPYDLPSPDAEAMRRREVLVFPRFEALEAEFPEIAQAMSDTTGERSIASTPLIVDGHPIGGLHIGFDRPRELTDEEVAHLRAIGDVAAQAIRRIQLVDAERRGRRMLDATLDQMPLGVIVADAQGRLILRNPASDRIWGGTPADRPDGPASAAGYKGFHPDGTPYAYEDWPLSRSLHHGEVVAREEIEIETFSGERKIVEDVSAPILDDDGSIIGGVVVFSDVTQRREATELRDAFLGMLSHELRTPITSIYGASNLLVARGEQMGEEVRHELTGDIRVEADRLYRLVENLLVMARAERGATHVDPAPVLLQRLVPRIVESEAAVWPSIRLWSSVPESLPPVRADEAFIELILRNVIGNAAKYAPGPVEVRVSRTAAERTICIDVFDSGGGIPEEELDGAFQLFRRVSSHGSSHVPGSGIGLFVVQHLAKAMGGEAWARNRPEGGLDVGFSLPIDPEAF